MNRITGTALITGASSGIGAEFARQLAAAGHALILVARRQERLQQFKDELEAEYNIPVTIHPADLAQLEQIAALVAFIQGLDELAILINNAGFGTMGNLGETDSSKQTEMVTLHVLATMELTQAALPKMRQQGSGHIINVSSIAAFVTGPGNVNYCATKAYINSFSRSLQLELKGSGVYVQALCPGYTYSEFHDRPEMDGFERRSMPRYLWMPATDVVRESLAYLGREKVIVIPGLLYKWMVAGLQSWLVRVPLIMYQRYLGK